MRGRIVDGLPRRVELGGRIVIGIAVPDRRDRAPELIVILGIEDGDERVGDRCGDQRHEPCAVDELHLLRSNQLANDGVIADRARDEPELPVLGLARRPLFARLAAQGFDLVVVSRPFRAGQRDRRLRSKLGRARHGKGLHFGPHRGSRDRRRHVNARLCLRPIRIGRIGTVAVAVRERPGGDVFSELDASGFRRPVRDGRQITRQGDAQFVAIVREQLRQDATGRRGCSRFL